MCIGCKQRATPCRSQEFDDENAPETGHKSDPPLARRLDRLEQMMERLVDKIVPDDSAAAPEPSPGQQPPPPARRSRSASSHGAPSPGRRESSVDVLETSAASDGPIAALLALRHESVHRRGPSESGHNATPALASVESSTPTVPGTAASRGTASRPRAGAGAQTSPLSNKHFWVCNTLRDVVPPRAAVDGIVAASPGAPYIVALCHSEAERHLGKVESTSCLAEIPPVSSHPLGLAKRALQVLICIQQLPPTFDWDALDVGSSRTETVTRLSNTSMLVTTNDELIGYAEGIECLLLQGYYQANCGSLRKAWVTFRRALSLAQMMGIDKGRSVAFRSCDPGSDRSQRTSAEVLWYKVVYWERYLSLLLGLPVGSQGDEFASEENCQHDAPIERLEKTHTVLAARISERNDGHRKDPTRHHAHYALTQGIDLDLEAAAKALPPGWWDEPPRLDAFAPPETLWEATAQVLEQIHHFTLVLLLHVPYMLRDPSSPRYDYSKTASVSAARALLSRFLAFRTHNVSAHSCRRVDYAGLLAAMTLCLSYLGRRLTESWERARLGADAELVALARRRMEHVARVNGDRLGSEAVGIIEQLAPIIDRAAAAPEGPGAAGAAVAAPAGRPGDTYTPTRDLRFNVPYLGSISVRMPEAAAAAAPPSADWQQGHRRHPSSATGALERMAIASPAEQQPARGEASSDVGFVQLSPFDDRELFGAGEAGLDFMASGEEWALQGVDAAYWSLFEGVV